MGIKYTVPGIPGIPHGCRGVTRLKWIIIVSITIIILFFALECVKAMMWLTARDKDFAGIISDECSSIEGAVVEYAKANNGKLPPAEDLETALTPKYFSKDHLEYRHNQSVFKFKAANIIIEKEKGLLVYLPVKYLYTNKYTDFSWDILSDYKYYPGCIVWESDLSRIIVALDDIPQGTITTLSGINPVAVGTGPSKNLLPPSLRIRSNVECFGVRQGTQWE